MAHTNKLSLRSFGLGNVCDIQRDIQSEFTLAVHTISNVSIFHTILDERECSNINKKYGNMP